MLKTYTINALECDTSNNPISHQAILLNSMGIGSNDTKLTNSPKDINEEIEHEGDFATVSQKRKLASINNDEEEYGDIEDDEDDEDMEDDTSLSTMPSQESPAAKRPKSMKNTRGVIVGVWRDSCEPKDEKKHVVFGFIDIHDRLRTRLYPMNRQGEELLGNFPTGAGGYWVTSERILFDEHLQGLSPLEIKEYIKTRQVIQPKSDLESKEDDVMIEDQTTIIQSESSPGIKQSNFRSAGASTRSSIGRQLLPREPMNRSPKAVTISELQTPKSSPLVDGKFQGVPLGFWTESDGACDKDKHAVFGVLIGTDSFRVKVARQTRDGRPRDGNYPVGPGALWIHYDKVFLEPHLRACSRPEVKEYCRIRLEELQVKETEQERIANDLKAVARAKEVVTGNIRRKNTVFEHYQPSTELESRKSTRSEQRKSRQKAEIEASINEVIRPNKNVLADTSEKLPEKNNRKDIQISEASMVEEAAEKELKSNIKKLNKVWVAQQAVTIPGVNCSESAGASKDSIQSETRYHNGIKYERKKIGPFHGKLVSSAQILSIDGEDFVEYRILTKPSFD